MLIIVGVTVAWITGDNMIGIGGGAVISFITIFLGGSSD